MNHLYILNDNRTPVPFEGTIIEWAEIWERQRIVKHTLLLLPNPPREVLVSTIFLGINHNFADGLPILWETMVLGPDVVDELQRRDNNETSAIEIHDEIVMRLRRDYDAKIVIEEEE